MGLHRFCGVLFFGILKKFLLFIVEKCGNYLGFLGSILGVDSS